MKARLVLLGAVMALVMAGCGDDSEVTYNENVHVQSVTMHGTVSGKVYSAVDGNPLEGVEVTVTVGASSLSTTTDENGFFSVTDVPAYGEVYVTYAKDGFYSAYASGRFPEMDGDVPHDGMAVTLAPVWMIATGGSLRVWVGNPDGEALAGVKVMAMVYGRFLTVNEDGEMVTNGSVAISAVTDGSGIAVLQGLPTYPQMGYSMYKRVSITVPDVDVDGDGVPEYSGTTANNVDVSRTSYYEITLNWYGSMGSSIAVQDSSFYYLTHSPSDCTLPGAHEPGESVFVLFNTRVSGVQIDIYDEEGTLGWSTAGTGANLQYSLERGEREVRFALPAELESGKQYWISIMAQREGSSRYLRTVPFFVAPPEDTPLAIQTIHADDPVNVTKYIVEFNYPMGTACSGITSIPAVGGRGIVFVYVDLDNSGLIGDAPSELGSDSSNIVFSALIEAPSLPNITGYVGFSRKWYFANPMNSGTLPLNTTVSLHFFNVSDGRYLLTTPWGEYADVLELGVQPVTN